VLLLSFLLDKRRKSNSKRKISDAIIFYITPGKKEKLMPGLKKHSSRAASTL
jgi:hypothetical protein